VLCYRSLAIADSLVSEKCGLGDAHYFMHFFMVLIVSIICGIVICDLYRIVMLR